MALLTDQQQPTDLAGKATLTTPIRKLTGVTSPTLTTMSGGVGGALSSLPNPTPTSYASPTASPAVSPYSVPYGQTSTFGTGSNLISSQITPGMSPRAAGAADLTDTARNTFANYQTPNWYGVGADTSGSQGIYDQLVKLAQAGSAPTGGFGGAQLNAQLQPILDKVLNGPDRGKLAADTYGLLLERSQPQYDMGLRTLGQKAASLGRIGAGMTTNELTDFGLARERGLDQSRRQLATESAGQSLQDALAQLGAAKDVYGSVAAANSGMALAGQRANQQQFENLLTLGRDIYGREGDVYGRGVNERQSQLGYGQQGFENAGNRFGTLAADENRLQGYDAANRGELRGERDYQYGLSQDAIANNARQRAMEDALLNSRMGRASTVYGAGNSGPDLANLYGQVGNEFGQQAAQGTDAMTQLLQQYGANQAMGRRPAPSPTSRYDPYDVYSGMQ